VARALTERAIQLDRERMGSPRRGWLRAAIAFAGGAVAGCDPERFPAPASNDDSRPTGRWRALSHGPDASSGEGHRALVDVPAGSETWPVVVALHGRGEAARGLEAGARGFRDDYGLERMRGRLEAGGVSADDVDGWLSANQLGSLAASLRARPYEGIVVASPYTPVPHDRSFEGSRAFASHIVERLLPDVARLRGGAPLGRTSTGIDGISMGGRYALQLGWSHPEQFGAVGALQPAIAEGEADAFADRAAEAAKRHPQQVRLASSEDDPFLPAVRALSSALDARGVRHQLLVTAGPHDYAWNRGPGVALLLAFHERVLRGLPPP
jgi:dienelactone hydrolase